MGALSLPLGVEPAFSLALTPAAPRKGKRAPGPRQPKTETAQHSCDSAEWYTPEPIITAARAALGGVIDLDPASSAVAHEHVRAVAYCNQRQNGLAAHWFGRIFLNPPNPPMPWWKHLVEDWTSGSVTHAVFVAYNSEQLSQLQMPQHTPGVLEREDVRLCLVAGRLRFMCTAADKIVALRKRLAKPFKDPKDQRAMERMLDRTLLLPPLQLVPGASPTHGSALIGLGIAPDVWRAAFSSLGACR